MKIACLIVAAMLTISSVGCSCAQTGPNMRQRMLDSSLTMDPHFPDGDSQFLTNFSYIGDVDTKDGVLRIASVTSVLTGMPSPRGQQWIAVYDVHGNFVGRQSTTARPLWCEDGKVFLFGVHTNGEYAGNVWDFTEGFEQRRNVMIERYGSYLSVSAQ